MMTTLPIPLVLRLRMPRRQKFIVATLLAAGYVVCVAGAIRTYYVWYFYNGTWDMSWYIVPGMLAASIENDLGIVSFLIRN